MPIRSSVNVVPQGPFVWRPGRNGADLIHMKVADVVVGNTEELILQFFNSTGCEANVQVELSETNGTVFDDEATVRCCLIDGWNQFVYQSCPLGQINVHTGAAGGGTPSAHWNLKMPARTSVEFHLRVTWGNDYPKLTMAAGHNNAWETVTCKAWPASPAGHTLAPTGPTAPGTIMPGSAS